MVKDARRHPTRGLTEGAILAALTVIVAAAGLIAPFVGVLLAPLPIMLLVIRWGLRTAVLAAVVASAVLFEFVGPLNALSAAAMFAPLGLALGWGVWRGIGAELTILAGAVAFLLSAVAALLAATALLHQDLIGQFIKSQVEAMQMTISLQQRLGAPSQQIDELRQAIVLMPRLLHAALPVMLGLGALLWSYLCYIVARAVLRRVGHALPGVPPILAWRVPPLLATALLWTSGGLSLASLRVPPLATAALDAMLVTLFVFGFQGTLVGIKWLAARQIPRFAIVLAGVLLISGGILPIAAIAMIGVLDTWFDYRRLSAPAAASAQAPDDEPDAGHVPGRDPANDALDSDGAVRDDQTKAVHP
ncbi:MAG TPA: DUF2232 domain-containing protein [bacterium]|nr:DUF2232 domain-containing protein [bacterium]